jgi:hypothetical protein
MKYVFECCLQFYYFTYLSKTSKIDLICICYHKIGLFQKSSLYPYMMVKAKLNCYQI